MKFIYILGLVLSSFAAVPSYAINTSSGFNFKEPCVPCLRQAAMAHHKFGTAPDPIASAPKKAGKGGQVGN